MRFIEKVFVVFALIAVIIKLTNSLGAAWFLLISILGLAALYLLFGFLLYNGIRLRNIFSKKSYSDISTRNIITAIFAGIVHSITLIGILFSIQHWQGSFILLLGGLLINFILSVIVYLGFRKRVPLLSRNIFIRASVIMLIAFGILLKNFI